jgi:hypothetical protein
MYVGTASPTRISSQDDSGNQSVYGIQKFNDNGQEQEEFGEYLTERLKHLSNEDQAKLKQVLKEYHHLFFREGSLVYLDDLICYSATMDEHVHKLRKIFQRLEQANFNIQPDKCVFATDSVEYLGHIVTKDGVKPDPRKIRTIRNTLYHEMLDHFTRFCEAIPVPNQETETIAKEFVTGIITQFGVPKKLLTDRGASFTSALMKGTCKLLKIQKLQTSSYNAQADGKCEEMHNLLIDMLSHFANRVAKNWVKYVPFAVMSYKATPHCTVKYSPYYLVSGRDLRLPIEDDWKPRIHTEANSEVDYENHVRQLAERLRERYKVAGQQSKQSHRIAKRYYDQKSTHILYKKGELVYLHYPIAKRESQEVFISVSGPL